MYTPQNPWIAQREATICTWKFDYNRGYISNADTSLVNDFMCLSDRQLRDYARMIKACGFTGIQVMDICAAWRASGSWENVHDKFKKLSAACHDEGLNFTVWCWAAEFSGHGWTEPEAVYRNSIPGEPAYKDPRVQKLFNKYYDIYADLAPYVDRVIAHFFDPGNLTDMPSIIYFIRLLAEKFREKNPSIRIAVDTWGCPAGYPEALTEAGMGDVMLMELPFLPIWQEPGKRARFRESVKKLGCGLGVWGWYTADMEIDQLATMTVNNRVLKDVFNRTRGQADNVLVPDYWSETDSYHILNFFSLYAAGHLLIDSEDDPDRLLWESAVAVAGNGGEAEGDGGCGNSAPVEEGGCGNETDDARNTASHGNTTDAARLMRVLELIRDARSGDSWETYWWQSPRYALKNSDFDDILNRADAAICELRVLIDRPEPIGGIPLPVTRRQLYRLILPHLHQIRQLAMLRSDLDELVNAKFAGADKASLQLAVNSLSPEIPEYNCVTGLWGQPEARAAFELVDAFCRDNGLVPPGRSPGVRFRFKRRIIDRLTVGQRGLDARLEVDLSFYEGGAVGGDFIASLMEELADEGVLCRTDRGNYFLSDWRDHRFDFSM